MSKHFILKVLFCSCGYGCGCCQHELPLRGQLAPLQYLPGWPSPGWEEWSSAWAQHGPGHHCQGDILVLWPCLVQHKQRWQIQETVLVTFASLRGCSENFVSSCKVRHALQSRDWECFPSAIQYCHHTGFLWWLRAEKWQASTPDCPFLQLP
jgi:hypothetical protein